MTIVNGVGRSAIVARRGYKKLDIIVDSLVGDN